MGKIMLRREFLRYLLTSGIVLTGAGSVPALLGGCQKDETGKEIDIEKTYDFLYHLDEAEIRGNHKELVRSKSFTIAGETREVLFEHPDSMVTFKKVHIHKNARLTFGIGIHERLWNKQGDGVFFEIIITNASGKHSVYSRYIDPKSRPDDRKWFDEVIDLKTFEGEKVSFTFQTFSRNKIGDWAGWSDPYMNSTVIKRIKKTHHTNIILITLDTTRADHLSCYGYYRKTSPHLDKIAQRGITFLNATAPSTLTSPVHASLFTGLFPCQHGVQAEAKDPFLGDALPDYDFILTRLLKKHGFQTAGFVGGPLLKSAFGFAQGFDTYDDTWGGFSRSADRINIKVFDWLEKNYSSPFYLFINYFDPHAPYCPPNSLKSPFIAPYDGDIDFTTFMPVCTPDDIEKSNVTFLEKKDQLRVIDLYDTEILFMDYHLGKLLRQLENFELLNNTLLIITADHGESFGENNFWGHGGSLFEAQVRVPLIIYYPPQIKTPKVISHQVQITGIFSTILKALDIPLPPLVIGNGLDIDLLKIGENDNLPAYIFAERWSPEKNKVLRMLRTDRLKYLTREFYKDNKKTITEWIFNFQEDPHEEKNLIGINEKQDNFLRTELSKFIQKTSREKIPGKGKGYKALIDKNLRDQLKALGYVK